MNPSPERIQVSVRYDEPLIAMGLSAALEHYPDIQLVPDEGQGAGAPLLRGPCVVITDYRDGVTLAAQSRQRLRSLDTNVARVLVVTAHDREHEVRCALDAGVAGFLALDCKVQELLEGVRQVARGSRYLGGIAAQRIADSFGRSSLTVREQQVLQLVVTGRGNKRIALALGISLGTVKAHVKAIMSKLDARTRTEAANIAVARGLVEEQGTPGALFQMGRPSPSASTATQP